ncbi:MarR family winged helix-turn-helix transcriptional regulator [Labrys portucalensis]|uniref:MarR family transcriptional regulator n=1 Tax=Labrys neptuniae TaxID=376174 RepID=A0ABV6ZQD1_9HYPH|nr:MarR family transcriptional regulator [Labrys neptuniae]MDT3378519.1 MarR family transcriptional regulator [Labrys neptuniae]
MARSDKMEDQLAYLIASVNRQLEEDLEDRLRPEGIPIEQFRILTALAARSGLSMGHLAELVLVDATTLTKIIDRMVADALVYRGPDPNDRRKVLIYLASKGTALHIKLDEIVGDQQRHIIDRLRGDKAETLKGLLRDLMMD